MLAHITAQSATAVTGGQVAPPYHEFCLDCGVFAGDNSLDYDVEGAIMFGMCNFLSGVPGINLPPSSSLTAAGQALPVALQFSETAALLAAGNVTVAGVSGIGFTAVAIANNEARSYALMCATNSNLAVRWTLDLIACYQVKPLKKKNVRSYFMSMKETKVDGGNIHDLISSVYSTFPDIASDATLAADLTQNDFMSYHLGYASTASICTEVMNFLGALAPQVFNAGTIAAIAASLNAPHSRQLNQAIPVAARLHGYAYGKALKKDYGEWYQGEKAKAVLPASSYNSLLAMYTRLAALSDNSVQISAAPNVNAVIAATPGNCLGV